MQLFEVQLPIGRIVGIVCKMTVPFRIGSAMLSRTAAPSVSRAFSTSIALRAGPNDDAPQRVRTNPLIGNITRLQTPEPKAPEPKAPEVKAAPVEQKPVGPPVSDIPPPPPPATEPTPAKPSSPATSKPAAFNLDIASIIANKASAFGASVATDPMSRPQIRAKPVTGRTVFVKDRITSTSGPTPMVALRVLQRIVREQQVKTKYHSQRFHERKGLKKKRLRSQRWRARFKHGFKATVNRVIELKKQGW
ncbi:hypothetical protein ACJ41O_013289 [Fusarium nematophilum]